MNGNIVSEYTQVLENPRKYFGFYYIGDFDIHIDTFHRKMYLYFFWIFHYLFFVGQKYKTPPVYKTPPENIRFNNSGLSVLEKKDTFISTSVLINGFNNVEIESIIEGV